MATRVGIHSDSMLRDNCLEYQAFPVGFANADFEGNTGNPYLSGVKPPKYQRSAPKPVSADVMAVNNSKFLQGDPRENARGMLNQYQKEAREWKPPPVVLRSGADEWDRRWQELSDEGRLDELFKGQTREEALAEQNSTFYAGLRIPSRGTQMLVQTIATQAEIPSMDEILFRYSNLANRDVQKLKFSRLMGDLQRQNIMMPELNWTKAQYGTIPERKEQVRYLVERAYAQGSNIDLIKAFTVGIEELPTSSADLAPNPYLRSTSSVAGTSTQYSEASTQQGAALPAETTLPAQVQRK